MFYLLTSVSPEVPGTEEMLSKYFLNKWMDGWMGEAQSDHVFCLRLHSRTS